MTGDGPFHVSGDWQPVDVPNTGAWKMGPMWLDRSAHRYALMIGPQHCNGLGTMHGGAMATFLDSQVFAAIDLAADGSDHTPTISLHVDYLAPTGTGAWLIADVILVKTTRTMIFTQAIAWVGDRAVARSHAIYRNYQRNVPE